MKESQNGSDENWNEIVKKLVEKLERPSPLLDTTTSSKRSIADNISNAFIDKNHEKAKKLFERLGLGFEDTPKDYPPSLWVIDRNGDIIGQILLEENQKWTSNKKWLERFIGENIVEGTDCKELAALLEIASSIIPLCFNEFRDTDGVTYG